MAILVLADTHLTGHRAGLIDDLLASHLDAADAIVHAGDVTAPEVLQRLSHYAPLYAVAGNNDVGLTLSDTLEVSIDGVRIAVVHDSGPASGRDRRLAHRFPNADVVVFGHSHLPWNDVVTADGRTQHHFNPGSPTQRRRAPRPTVGWIDIGPDGTITCRHEVVGEPTR